MRNQTRPPASRRARRAKVEVANAAEADYIVCSIKFRNSRARMVPAVRQRHVMSMETKSAAHPDVCYGVLVRKLSAAGVRPTRQRLDLARAIFGAGNRHFTAEMIFQETRSIQFAPTLGHDLQHAQRVRALWAPAGDRDLRRQALVRHQDRAALPLLSRGYGRTVRHPGGLAAGVRDPASRRHERRGDRRDREAEEALMSGRPAAGVS